MTGLAAALLVGVLHVHHEPSHDSSASFAELLEAAQQAELDFLVLSEHAAPEAEEGPLPAAERAGTYPGADRGELLVLVGVELGTRDGHLLAYDVPHLVPATDRPGADVIADVHALGGFAVVPHPLTHGGWHAWDAPFDGIEVHNHASAFRHFAGPLLPFHVIRSWFDPPAVLRSMLERPHRELERWDELLASGRQVVAFSGADAHRNVSLLGWQLDPYEQMLPTVVTVCPDTALEPEALWRGLRSGRCWIRYALYDDRADESEKVVFPSGRSEWQLDGGRRVFEIRNRIIGDGHGPDRPAQ